MGSSGLSSQQLRLAVSLARSDPLEPPRPSRPRAGPAPHHDEYEELSPTRCSSHSPDHSDGALWTSPSHARIGRVHHYFRPRYQRWESRRSLAKGMGARSSRPGTPSSACSSPNSCTLGICDFSAPPLLDCMNISGFPELSTYVRLYKKQLCRV